MPQSHKTATKVSAKFRREATLVSQDKVQGPIVKALAKKFARVSALKVPKPTIIHVNQHVIKANRTHGTNEPPLTIRKGHNGRNAQRAHEVVIHGPSKLVHSAHKPLKCGARLWIETDADVTLNLQK